jgi:hypothetical protein
VVGADGQLPVAAVHEHGEADHARPADVHEGVEGGAHGAPGVQDVVDEDHGAPVDALHGDAGRLGGAGGVLAQVVAEHRDVELAEARGGVEAGVGGGDLGGDPLGQRIAAARDAEQDEVRAAPVGLEDLVGDARQGAVDVGCREDDARGGGSRRGTGRGGVVVHGCRLLPRLTGRT